MTHRLESPIGRRLLLSVLCVWCALCAAPTPGDIGGCGTAVEDLDAQAFFAARRAADCDACRECGLSTERCAVACSGESDEARTFPEGCFPLVFDGQVCLRALRHSSCEDYAAYVADAAASVPTECDFCPIEARP